MKTYYEDAAKFLEACKDQYYVTVVAAYPYLQSSQPLLLVVLQNDDARIAIALNTKEQPLIPAVGDRVYISYDEETKGFNLVEIV